MHRTAKVFRDVVEARKKLPKGIIIRGDYTQDQVNAIKQTLGVSPDFALESMQVEQARQEQQLKSLFFVKPKQTGLAATAAMTAEAIRNPDSTAIVVMHSDDTTPDEKLDVEKLVDTLLDEGVETYNSFDLVMERLAQTALECDAPLSLYLFK